MVFGILGNLSIILIICKNRLLRLQVTNLFLVNMAVSDCLNLTINPILYYFRANNIFINYHLGEFFCKLTPIALGK